MPKQTRKKTSKTNHIPYTKGFRQPTRNQQLKAIGLDKKLGSLPLEYTPHPRSFSAIPKCTSIDDWLAQYCEEGQTYHDFLDQCPWLSWRKVKYVKHTFKSDGSNIVEKYPNGVIYVLPLGDFGKESPNFDALIDYAQTFYSLPVKKLPGVTLETQGKNIYWVRHNENGSTADSTRVLLQSRYNVKSGNRQLKVHSGLTQLRDYMPEDGICMIALTMFDLYEANPDLFVAGMAAGSQRVAIFSLRRYDPNLVFSQEFWYQISEKKRYNSEKRAHLLLQRSCRLLVHELGHLLGVDHCIYFDCCMNGSGHLQEDFRQSMLLCPVDLRKLQKLCGFDVVDRYRKLQSFYQKHGFSKEALWIQERLALIHENRQKDLAAAPSK